MRQEEEEDLQKEEEEDLPKEEARSLQEEAQEEEPVQRLFEPGTQVRLQRAREIAQGAHADDGRRLLPGLRERPEHRRGQRQQRGPRADTGPAWTRTEPVQAERRRLQEPQPQQGSEPVLRGGRRGRHDLNSPKLLCLVS